MSVLTPRQREWLRLSRDSQPPGVLVVQLVGELRDQIAPAAFRAAWRRLLERHPELRTRFQWNGAPDPVPVMQRRVAPRWHQEDWSELSRAEQYTRQEMLLAADRDRGIAADAAPLFRFSLVRSGAGSLWFVWTYHRALLETAYSLEIVRELFTDCRNGRSLPPPPRQEEPATPPSAAPRVLRPSTPLAVAGAPPATPTDPEAARGGRAGRFSRHQREIHLRAATANALQAFTRAQHLSWPSLFAGLWAILLSRYSGEEEVVFGLNVDGQVTTAQIALQEGAEFATWLRTVQIGLANADAERATWETVLNCSLSPRQLKLTGDGAHWRFQLLAPPLEPVSLRVESGRRCRLVVEYDPERLGEGAMNRLLQHFQVLCEAVAATPQRPVRELPLLTGPEQDQLLVQWNSQRADYPLERTYPELFAAQAQLEPAAVAVRAGDADLTYIALDQWSNQLACQLQTLGIGPDVPVGICLERSLELPVAMLAVMKAGGAYLPLDPSYPAERLAYMLRDAGAAVVVTRRRHAEALTELGPHLVHLEDWRAEITGQLPAPRATPDHLAYLMYTSGSTGNPKGVAIPQRALVNHNCAVREAYGLTGADRVLQFASLNFDLSVEEIFPTWLAGATLVLRPADLLGSVERFLAFVRAEQITVLNLPTAYWQELCQTVAEHPLPACVRLVIIGGEKASPEAYRLWKQSGVPLINTYGPTETTVSATLFRGGETDDLPIGRPFPNVHTYVLDRAGRPVPIGVSGELHIGGAGLARGYWRQPQLTAQKFLPNPFRPGERLYRTGDLVRYRWDGNLEFIGRTDAQIKWRGYRIELGEIEAALRQCAGVRDAIVLVREDKLVAYHLGDSDDAVLRQTLQQRLPDYMLPSALVGLTEWPLTPGGKVDRRALPAPTPVSSAPTAGPRDPLEQQLAQIWQTVLGVERVGADDNFFALGGHSLVAMRLLSQIEKVFGKQLPVTAVYQAGTVAKLAELLRTETPMRFASSLVEIQARGARPPLYFVHGIGGGLFWGYSNIARHLGTEQPVYVFKSRGLDGLEEFSRIEDMAAQYVGDLRAFQPHGPYQLGGYCFGGNVAYEMAQQLQAAGERVRFLCLLNCPPTNTSYLRPVISPWVLVGFAANVLYRLGRMTGWSHAQRREFFRWKWRQLHNRWRRAAPNDEDLMLSDDIFDLSAYTPEQRRLWQIHARAYAAYLTRPYGGPVTLLRSRGHPFWCSFDRYCGWRELVSGPLQMRIVPGAHETILREPHVASVARALSAAIEVAR